MEIVTTKKDKEKIKTAWTDVFMPNKISDIVGHKKAITEITQWLNNFDKNKSNAIKENLNKKKKKKTRTKVVSDDEVSDLSIDDEEMLDDENEPESIETGTGFSKLKTGMPSSCILVTGSHGIGKTCTVITILKELNYEVQSINFTKIKNTKQIEDIINNLTNGTNIMNTFFGSKKRNALVIDEIESVSSKTEKKCILEIIKNNELNWTQPIIFIANNQHNKLIGEIRKVSQEIKFWPPYPGDMEILISRICTKTGIRVNGPLVVNKIIEHAQKDNRRLIFILQDLKYIFGERLIKLQDITEYCITSKKKDIDFDLFKATEFLILKYNGIEESLKYYETEKVLLPLMMHQNYITSINSSLDSKKDKFEIADSIATRLSKGDVIENYIYSDQNWDLPEIHGFLTCALPSYELNTYLDDFRSHRLDFPFDLNRFSIKKINKKNIINVSKCLSNMDTEDYLYINQMVKKLIDENRLDECFELFEGYQLKLENIESLLKVDKIQTSKITLTTKQKKEFNARWA